MYHRQRRHVKNSTASEHVPPPRTAVAVAMLIGEARAKAATEHREFLCAAIDKMVTCHDMRVLSNVHQRVPYFQGLCPARAHYSLCVLMGLGYVSAQQIAECVQ